MTSDNEHKEPVVPEGARDDVVIARARRRSRRRLIALVLGPALALAVLLLPAPDGFGTASWRLVGLAGWMVVWWLGEAVPLPATALLPIPFMPLMGIAKMAPTAANYGHPLIFLFLGGFVLAAAMQRWGLHRRIALRIVRLAGASPGGIIAGFMAASAFLSMWISNTAAAIMMYAVGLSVIGFVSERTPDRAVTRNFAVALMLGIAYSASIGGAGTLIGTPPNALLASFLQEAYGIRVSFFTWMLIGLPVVAVMLPLAWLLLTRVIYPARRLAIGDMHSVIHDELAALGPMSRGERTVAAVFVAAALGWILNKPVAGMTGLPINDTTVALIAACLLFALPVSLKRGQFAVDWETVRQVPWGILLLFGGGLALAAAFKSTGLSGTIGTAVGGVPGVSVWVIVLLSAALVIYLTEITSNTASTATLLPVMGAVAVGLGQDPRLLTVPVALGASMAFMMPVATPPNAIVFAYEDMELADMVRAGFWLNVIAVIVCFGAVYLLAGAVFGVTVK